MTKGQRPGNDTGLFRRLLGRYACIASTLSTPAQRACPSSPARYTPTNFLLPSSSYVSDATRRRCFGDPLLCRFVGVRLLNLCPTDTTDLILFTDLAQALPNLDRVGLRWGEVRQESAKSCREYADSFFSFAGCPPVAARVPPGGSRALWRQAFKRQLSSMPIAAMGRNRRVKQEPVVRRIPRLCTIESRSHGRYRARCEHGSSDQITKSTAETAIPASHEKWSLRTVTHLFA